MADEKQIELTPTQKAAAEAKARREARAKEIEGLKSFIGKTATPVDLADKRVAAIVGIEPDKMIKARVADAFIINLGNPNAFHFVHCDEFQKQFNIKQQE